MTVWEYVLLFLSVLLGGGAALYIRRHQPLTLRLLLSFSGAYILSIAALHLLPGIFADGESNIGLWLLLGFFIQIVLEQFSLGVEHGHVHAHAHARAGYGIQILIGLCLHSFIEGMPLSGYLHLHEQGGEINHLLYGIILHKAPAAFALGILLVQSDYRRRFVIVSLVIFSLMSPLGAFIGEQFIVSPLALQRIMALVVGSFLHISTTILFEAEGARRHQISWRKLLAMAAGLFVALLTMLE